MSWLYDLTKTPRRIGGEVIGALGAGSTYISGFYFVVPGARKLSVLVSQTSSEPLDIWIGWFGRISPTDAVLIWEQIASGVTELSKTIDVKSNIFYFSVKNTGTADTSDLKYCLFGV